MYSEKVHFVVSLPLINDLIYLLSYRQQEVQDKCYVAYQRLTYFACQIMGINQKKKKFRETKS